MRHIVTALALTAFTLANAQSETATTLTDTQVNAAYNSYFSNAEPRRVTVHDPSVVIGYEKADGTVTGEPTEGAKKVYCIFGSHKAWAKSYDMQNWSYFSNNISSQFATIFAEDAKWSAHGGSSYDVSGNLWAPDVIWNKHMKKWCMYMSVNGDRWYSSIVMLTAESLTGNWQRVGPVIYSFGSQNSYAATETDILDIIGGTSVPSRYWQNRNGTLTYGTNCIDPCVFYDQEENMWMTYGSWFGGLYMIRLDATTGMRDKTYTYTTDDGTAANAKSDEYMGIKVAGGNHVSGEASYIEYRDGRYWLFVTNGGLTAKGGYSMRVFSSENVTGPYKDISGQDARVDKSMTLGSSNCPGTINGYVGTRLMSYYRWNHMSIGFTAQGHNSAVVDTDAEGNEKMFLVYHTRFDDGTEGHQVRVHQLFTTQDGRMTCAPMEYRGETLSKTGYATEAIAGSYRILYHGVGTNHAALECVKEKSLTLNADGTVTGDYTGTWTAGADKPSISINLSNGNFQGFLIEQNIEGTNIRTLCFTAVNDKDLSLWGYRCAASGQPFPDDATVAYNVRNLSNVIPSVTYKGSTLDLPAEGAFGATYSWTSADPTIISNDGKVADVTADTECEMIMTIEAGSCTYTKRIKVSVLASSPKDMLPISESSVLATYPTGDIYNATTAKTQNSISSQTGASISFLVSGLASDWDVVARATDGSGFTVFLSCLRLNSNNTDWYEASATASADAQAAGVASWQLFLDGTFYVTISYNADGTIAFYRDGKLMLTYAATTKANNPSGSTSTVSQVCTKAINLIKSGKLEFTRPVTEVIVGYGVGYQTAVECIEADGVTIRAAGRTIAIDGMQDGDIAEVRDMSGRLVYRGTESRIGMTRSGIYAVSVGNHRKLVPVK